MRILAFALLFPFAADPARALEVGFAHADITPAVGEGETTVWIAGYGMGRRAKDVHDPLFARALVLRDEGTGDKIALVSVDLVGLQRPAVIRVREALPGYKHVLVSSTHNHEGPDVIGIWGQHPARSGVDPEYIDLVVERCASAVREAGDKLQPVTASFGTAEDKSLIGDSRLPKVIDGTIRTLRFKDPKTGADRGVLVQWNCHPEAMGPANTSITADFTTPVVDALREEYKCPVIYFTGAVGGLMAPPRGRIKDAAGVVLREGQWEYMERYGEAVAELAKSALAKGAPLRLTPFAVASQPLLLRIENKLYRAAYHAGILQRQAYIWDGPAKRGAPLQKVKHALRPMAVETEVGALRLGELRIAAIPGEIYPELVYGEFQEPADPAADFPEAELEPTVRGLMPDDRWLLLGLASDEIGYIIPKRQWDSKTPYAYGREKGQYGEANSCGPDVAPALMRALAERLAELAE